MPDTIQWVLLELGLLVGLFISFIVFSQWRRRRAAEQAIRALSQRVKQSEAERKRTLVGILTGAHRLPEARSAELADNLIRSEHTFFRHCFEAMLSQDKDAIATLDNNLHGVLDDYLRMCAPEIERAPPAHRSDVADNISATTVANKTLLVPAAGTVAAAATVSAPPMPDEEVDWDAAFAEQFEEEEEVEAKPSPATAEAVMEETEEPAPPIAIAPEPAATPGVNIEDTLHHLLNALDEEQEEAEAEEPLAAPIENEAEEEPADDEDVMADWGAALEEQATTPAKAPAIDDGFDLGWDDAFLEETVVIKPDQNKKAG